MSEVQKSKKAFPPVLAWPGILWFTWFVVVPLGIVVLYSLASRGTYGGVVFHFSFENFSRALNATYLSVFLSSLKLATFTTLSCLAIGYPMAYVMATSSRKVRTILLAMVILPFLTNFVVRAYAIKQFLSDRGPLNELLLFLGFITNPIPLADGSVAVWFGMVTNYLPFMVLPLYVALEKFDFSLLEAARDLGATPLRNLWHILIPMTKPGILTGIVFVFTPTLGEFVIPDLLGGARTMLIGNLVTEQFLKSRDWPFGSALSLLLILIVMASLAVYLRTQKDELVEWR